MKRVHPGLLVEPESRFAHLELGLPTFGLSQELGCCLLHELLAVSSLRLQSSCTTIPALGL